MTTDVWSLEVARGPEAGRRYALGRGAIVLGNALEGEPGIDLSELERGSPRRMAAKQARIDVADGSLKIRDLDSPGGSFVNRQRLLAGAARPLADGDLIQLGGVQLRVIRVGRAPNATTRAETPAASPPSRPQTGHSGFVFTLKSGEVCRSWDDLLTVSTQRWDGLRDELTSGRLAGFLASIGRSDLAPDPNAPGSPDERLDAWIGRLPTTRPARPELEAHPRSVTFRAAAGGGVTRKKIRVSNTGYGLLRTTARVEPAGTTWMAIAAEFDGKPFATVESTDLPVEARLPEGLTAPLSATLVLESNGGTIHISVRVEPATSKAKDPLPGRTEPLGVRAWIGRRSAASRWIGGPLVAIVGRMAIGIADILLPVAGGSPGLLGPAVVLGGLGAGVGLLLSGRSGEVRDLPPAAIAGAILGAMLAAIAVAACRTVEGAIAPVLGSSLAAILLLWGAIGAGIAALSLIVSPPSRKSASEPEARP